MKSLDTYILKHIAAPAALAFFIIAFLGVASKLRDLADSFPHELLTPSDLILLALFLLPTLFSIIIPVAYFIGILMAFGKLAQQGEITAMQAAGISMKRMVLPPVILGIALSFVCLAMEGRVRPWTMGKAYYIMHNLLPQRATLDRLDAGEVHDYGGYRVYFATKDTTTHTLYDFDLIQPQEDGITVFHAESAQLLKSEDEFTLILTNGYSIAHKLRANFRETKIPLEIPGQKSIPNFTRNSLNLINMSRYERELHALNEADDPKKDRRELHKTRRELAQRISTPFTVAAIALIGAPLGVRAKRKGKTSLFGIGFAIILVYYVILSVSVPTSLSNLSTYVLRAWAPNLMLIALGLILFTKADRV